MSRCSPFGHVAALLLAWSAIHAQDYYVDAAGGADANTGTSAATAWKTVAKVNGAALHAGDRVRFKRGCMWREQLAPTAEGAAGSPITFDDFGPATAAKPCFTGSLPLTVTAWTRSSANPDVWTYAVSGGMPKNEVCSVLFAGQYLLRFDPANAGLFEDQALPWSYTWDAAHQQIKIKLYHDGYTANDDAGHAIPTTRFTTRPEWTVRDPRLAAYADAWRAVMQDDIIFNNFKSHLVFRNLEARDSAWPGHNGGYCVRIQGGQDVLVEGVDAYRAGKHHFGCINATAVVFRGLHAAYAHPDLGRLDGGQTAFVSYSDSGSGGPTTSEYHDCTYDNTEDWYKGIYSQYGAEWYFVFTTHGANVASVLLDNVRGLGGANWEMRNDERPDSSLRIVGGRLENGRLSVMGHGISVDGLTITGERATIDLTGTDHLLQNLVISGTKTGGWDKQTAILSRGAGNTVRFSTIVTSPAAGSGQSCIGTSGNGNAPSCYGNILIANGPVLDLADASFATCGWNLYKAGVRFAAGGGTKTFAEWQAAGHDAGSLATADPLFADTAAGDYRLQAASLGIDAAPVTLPHLPATDAAGAARPQGNTYDIGAFERPATGAQGPVVIAPGTPVYASTQAPFTYQVEANNHPTTYTASGLPPGLAINRSTGLIIGTPTATGTFTVQLTAANTVGSGHGALGIVVVATANRPLSAPFAVPGTIQAEDFDLGGEGHAYHNPSFQAGMGQLGYRTDGAQINIDTGGSDGGYALGWIQSGEWTAYTINVATARTYQIELRVASGVDLGAGIKLQLDGTDITADIHVPNTGDWAVYQTVTVSGISLPAGLHVLTLWFNSGGMNVNSIRISDLGGEATPPTASGAGDGAESNGQSGGCGIGSGALGALLVGLGLRCRAT